MADATGDTETDKHLGVFIIHVFRWNRKRQTQSKLCH